VRRIFLLIMPNKKGRKIMTNEDKMTQLAYIIEGNYAVF